MGQMAGNEAVYVQLLGSPKAQAGQQQVFFVPDKRFQLLSYLAYQTDWVSRERLAYLFWPDTDTQNAKSNLRGLLQRVRSLAWQADVEATPYQLRWIVETDVLAFRHALERGEVTRALAFYRGPLLQGLDSDEAPEFSEWLSIERERLHNDWRDTTLKSIQASEAEDHRHAEELLNRLFAEDALDEEALRVYMRASGRTGFHEQALKAYRHFTKKLSEELDLAPTSATQEVFEALQRETRAQQATIGSQAAAMTPRLTAAPFLSTASTPFIGREEELAEIIRLLSKPDCRLLTLIGPGGVGKTRMALRTVQSLADRYAGGVFFASLEALTSSAALPAKLAEIMRVSLVGEGDPTARLADHIGQRQVLIALDNFEHLLDGATIASNLVMVCPNLKLLVTSRERLNVQEEWSLTVRGLGHPGGQPVSSENAYSYDALRLFLARAQRVQPTFELTHQVLPDVVRIAHLVDGSPLALELAAAWVRVMPCNDIAREIEENLDFLTTPLRNVNERQRSIRATFESSWRRLSSKEQEVMRRLTVFQGGFDREAAKYAADAPLLLLANLVDKSLVGVSEKGRYTIHPLLLQYAQEKGSEQAQEQSFTEEKHKIYYQHFLTRWAQAEGKISDLDFEIGNLLMAAQRALRNKDEKTLVNIMRMLTENGSYYAARGHTSDSLALLEAAIEAAIAVRALEDAHHLLGKLGDVHQNLTGELDKALQAYLNAANFAHGCGNIEREAVFLSNCGVVRCRQGKTDATGYLNRAYRLAKRCGDDLCLCIILEHRGYVVASNNQWRAANRLFRDSLDVLLRVEENRLVEMLEINRRRFFALLNLGETEFRMGNFDEALTVRSQALHLAESCDNQIWVAHVLLEMGEMYDASNERAKAQEFLNRALVLYRRNHAAAYIMRMTLFMQTGGYSLPTD